MTFTKLRYWSLKLIGRKVVLSDDKKHIAEWTPASKLSRKASERIKVNYGN